MKVIRRQGTRGEHLLDVSPVARPVEHHLEDRELEWTEDRDSLSLEADGLSIARRVAVDRRVVEEEVNGGIAPPQPDLSLPLDLLGRSRWLRDSFGQRLEGRLRIARRHEDVYVDVAGAARLLGPVGQGDGTPEGMLDPLLRERVMDRKQPLRECQLRGDAVVLELRGLRFGYLSSARRLAGSASARVSTCAKTRPRRSISLLGGWVVAADS